jgi:hypothetical protein
MKASLTALLFASACVATAPEAPPASQVGNAVVNDAFLCMIGISSMEEDLEQFPVLPQGFRQYVQRSEHSSKAVIQRAYGTRGKQQFEQDFKVFAEDLIQRFPMPTDPNDVGAGMDIGIKFGVDVRRACDRINAL